MRPSAQQRREPGLPLLFCHSRCGRDSEGHLRHNLTAARITTITSTIAAVLATSCEGTAPEGKDVPPPVCSPRHSPWIDAG